QRHGLDRPVRIPGLGLDGLHDRRRRNRRQGHHQTHDVAGGSARGRKQDSMKQVLETDGQVCPFPLVEAKEAVTGLADGDELVINYDCTQATEAIPQWAAENGYPVTHFDRVTDASWTITVQKACLTAARSSPRHSRRSAA